MQCLHSSYLEKSAGSVLNRAAVIASANSPHRTTIRRTTMTTFKTLITAALVSMATVTSASAQLPTWAASNPAAFQAQYPDRDVLNGGALTPAGRMGLVSPGGAAPYSGANAAAKTYAGVGIDWPAPTIRAPRHPPNRRPPFP